jgi:DNA helicase IV
VRHRELTVNYRTPGSIMDVAARVLAASNPTLKPPQSARRRGAPLVFLEGDPVEAAAKLAVAHENGTLAIIAPRSLVSLVREATGIEPEDEMRAVLTPHEAKGLEFDEVIIVEPARIVAESAQGLRALYVALTRATQRATITHAEALPRSIR